MRKLNYSFLKKCLLHILFCICFFITKFNAQLINQFDQNRNIIYLSVSHLGTSLNSSMGYSRSDSLKKLNLEIIGFLDVLVPLNVNHFNKVAIRKGFQSNLIKVNFFSIPLVFSSTSVHRQNKLQNRHDITFDLDFFPTYRFSNLNLSLCLGSELIAFSFIKKNTANDQTKVINTDSHWEKIMKYVPKIGIQINYGLKRISFFLKSDLERNIYSKIDEKNSKNTFLMNVIGGCYKF